MFALKPFRRAARYLLVFAYFVATFALDLVGWLLRRLGWLRLLRVDVPSEWAPGVSVIIPERANAALLTECLTAATANLQRIPEPAEIIVVVNGSPAEDYRALEALFPAVRFIYFAEPLGFSRAIEVGLRAARYDWVYLLNNDMVLDPGAVQEALRWRAPHVFAIASQIFFRDPSRRREETGWTDFDVYDGWVTIFDVPPEESTMVRGNLYAGGGASLFRKALLDRFLDRNHPYHPAYWEDVEWGAIAWRCGFESLFCPASRAWHSHRATISQFYTSPQINAFWRLNNFRFQMRNISATRFDSSLFRWLAGVDGKTLRLLASPREIARTLAARWQRFRYPWPQEILRGRRARFYPEAPRQRDARPVLVVVAPYAVFPPVHGGAVRIHKLLAALAGADYRVILLSDERELYTNQSLKYMDGLDSVHLVSRGQRPRGDDRNRIARINWHSHPALRDELGRLIAIRQPSGVQVEYVELARLVDLRRLAARPGVWVLDLHDVLFSANGNLTAADRYEQALIRRFDAALVCSPEDRALLDGAAWLVPNGVDCGPDEYVESRGSCCIGFFGPFRYPPNLAGITRFAAAIFPQLKMRVPGAELWIFGGDGAGEIAAARPEFCHDGIRVFDSVQDVGPWFRQCSLTIAPLSGCRGSSLKVLQSVARGRVCVSTMNGARGYLDAGVDAIVTVPAVEDFVEPLVRLLLDENYRVELEQSGMRQASNFAWANSGNALLKLYEELIHAQSGRIRLRNRGASRRGDECVREFCD